MRVCVLPLHSWAADTYADFSNCPDSDLDNCGREGFYDLLFDSFTGTCGSLCQEAIDRFIGKLSYFPSENRSDIPNAIMAVSGLFVLCKSTSKFVTSIRNSSCVCV